jgi:hypothetical protein
MEPLSTDAKLDADERPAAEAGEISIIANFCPCINYASWQNSVPLLESIEICNRTANDFRDLRLQLDTTPAFTRAKSWIIQHIKAGDSIALRDRDVQLDPGYLNGLNEAERSLAAFRLYHRDDLIADASHDIRVLARDEWGGMNSMSELLAAFVMPNDPALAKVLKLASEVLAQHGHSSALDGYQTRDPRRAYILTAAIWSALADANLTYANPPRSFEQVGQKTRRPATVLADGLATCLDSTLLFAAAIEAVGLNPVIVMTNGHCFAGVWLAEKTFQQLVESECSEIRKAIAAKELITFETTLITHQPPARFDDAIKAAGSATRESDQHNFVAVVDVARARMSQIRPLASHAAQAENDSPSVQNRGPLPLPAAPNLGEVAGEQSEEIPLTPEGRVDRWQRKLLDLSLRNPLLNFRSTKQSVPVLCPDVSLLEDRLAAGAKLRLTSLPDQNPIGRRDAELHRQKTNQELDVEFARQALERNEVSCPVVGSELTNRLTTLYRKVRNDLAEGGSNTLFLAVGFLVWKKKAGDEKAYRAPLLLVPVKLIRNSALSPYHLVHHEDGVRFNATLIQLLKKDFDRDISSFESALPTDDSGVDVPLVLERMRREVRDIPGFEVVEESTLSTFSFAKYLMWKDLVDRVGQLEKNRVVRHLICNPDKPFETTSTSAIPQPHEIDYRFQPQDIFHPLPADSSQLSAVMAASEGQDYVLVGPPGTGKSQTIANIISQCLATGKTVLFVAEKTAALEVVYRRLRKNGLGDCCLELHSNRAERRKFLDQLEASWQNNRRTSADEWITVSDRLKLRRDELNAYVAAIHAQHPNGWSVFRALGIAVKGASTQAPKPGWADTAQHDAAAFQSLTNAIESLALTYKAIDPAAKLSRIRIKQWSAAWEAKLLSECDQLHTAASALKDRLSKFESSLCYPSKQEVSLKVLENLHQLAKELRACAGQDVRIMFNKQFAKFPVALDQLRRSMSVYADAKERATATYEGDSLNRLPVDEIDQQWRQAVASYWPMSWFAKRKVTRLLQSYASAGRANPATDLASIRTMQQQLAEISENPLAGQTDRFDSLQTDADGLQALLDRASTLRQAIVAVGQPAKLTNEIAKALLPALKGDAIDLPIYQLAQALISSTDEFLGAVRRWAEASGSLPFDKTTSNVISDAIATAKQVQANRTHLQRWTAWCDVRERASAVGLAPFVADLESGTIKPADLAHAFQISYSRWWLPKAIDRSSVLRTFQRFKHEDAIEDFRKIDDIARSVASSRVRQAVAHELPPADRVPRQSELGLLRHQMNLKRPSKSIRELISAMPEAFGKLAPCLLMSPLSIAQYLPAEQALFDVVIFDEASQITTWDAIGAIARGRQTIIVGDPKQLPPTNFFGRTEDDEDNDELDDHEKDLESILDEASASGLPTLQLNWHYRSRHESLIAFSNWHYYGNRLVTFPAAESADRGVSLCHFPNSVYDRGKSRTNRDEAEAIVRDAVARMKRCLSMPEGERLTFGVITFNSQQQALIQDLFDQAQRDDPELEWYFADDRIEPTIVKNLENVQGDERDVMFFSITFGPDAAGKLPLTFGALNRDGGERRLNVAVTRSRQLLLVYSSFKGEKIDAERSKKRGVRDLKNFLEYAEKGPIAIAATTEGSVGGFDSPFEEAVADALIEKGWQPVPQIGVSGFRVDLGIVHPDKPGAYLAGVECDGATYHRAAVARDRDKTRQQVLENLGWNIIRVWSPDWWYDSKTAIQRVDEALSELLQTSRSAANDNRPASSESDPPSASSAQSADDAIAV